MVTSSTETQKTYNEFFADLVKSISEKANKSLSHPTLLPSQPTLSNLEQIFRQITYDIFAKKFQYQFNAQSTVPPSLSPGTHVVTTFECFYKVQNSDKVNALPLEKSLIKKGTAYSSSTPIPDDHQSLSAILNDFKNQVTSLPNWAQAKAQREIVGRLDAFFTGFGIVNDWTTDVNTSVYEQSNRYANSIRLDSLFVRLSGSNEKNGVKATLDTVYCIGVYYEVVSSAAIARRDLWKSLYVQAGLLLDTAAAVIPDNPTPDQLEALLIWYRDNKMFQQDHGFPFNGVPDGVVSDLGRPTHLFIIEDDDFSKLPQKIQQSDLGKVKLPTWARSVLADLEEDIMALLKSVPSHCGWLPIKYNKSPPPPTKSEPMVLIKGNLLHCNLVTPAHKDVTYRAVYFCGVFYTAPSATEAASQKIVSVVYNSALNLVHDVGDKPDQPSIDDLDSLLYRALLAEFQSTFRCVYNREKTAPQGNVGNNIYYGDVRFHSETRDQAAMTKATEAIMSGLGLSSMNDGKLQKSIYDDIYLKVKHALEAEPLDMPLNSWDKMSHDRKYSYSNDSPNSLVGKCVLYYCNGSIQVQNTTIQRCFIYFVGVFYEVKVEEVW